MHINLLILDPVCIGHGSYKLVLADRSKTSPTIALELHQKRHVLRATFLVQPFMSSDTMSTPRYTAQLRLDSYHDDESYTEDAVAQKLSSSPSAAF